MNDQSQNFTEQGAAFQKLWLESMSKMMQAAFTFSPDSAPPELLKEIRNGILGALSESWNEFLRSPQFQENTKQWMDNAMAFRRLSNDFMAKAREEMQAPTRNDIDTIMLTVRHMENRILDRLEEMSKQIEELKTGGRAAKPARPGERTAAREQPARKGSHLRKNGKNDPANKS